MKKRSFSRGLMLFFVVLAICFAFGCSAPTQIENPDNMVAFEPCPINDVSSNDQITMVNALVRAVEDYHKAIKNGVVSAKTKARIDKKIAIVDDDLANGCPVNFGKVQRLTSDIVMSVLAKMKGDS
ncbi:MAG: hypothetical protein ABII97_00820 [Patescibacteria group bacterium]